MSGPMSEQQEMAAEPNAICEALQGIRNLQASVEVTNQNMTQLTAQLTHQGQQQQQMAEQQQQHFHALRQELTQRFDTHTAAVDTRFDAMEAHVAAVEQQQQQQQGGADTDAAAAAAAWDADTVRDALNQATTDHQVVGMRRPVWFDAECKHKRRVFVEAVRTGQAVHACKKRV